MPIVFNNFYYNLYSIVTFLQQREINKSQQSLEMHNYNLQECSEMEFRVKLNTVVKI